MRPPPGSRKPSKSQVMCPYCFERQGRTDLLYSCFPVCAAESGDVLTFSPADLSAAGHCPHGRRPQARRLCAKCGHDLLREYVDGEHQIITLIGAPGSGKSTFVGVLIHELRGRVGERFGNLAVDLHGEDSRLEYARKLENPLYVRGLTPAPTPPAGARATGRHPPIMFALRWENRRRRLPLLPPTVTTALLVFYDTAGEDLRNTDSVKFLTDYLAAASGIVLTVDTAALATQTATGRNPLEILEVISEHLREIAPHPTLRVRKPLAVVLTKIDAVTRQEEHFTPSSPLRRMSRHYGCFDETDSLDVHEDIRAWLKSHDLARLDRTLVTNFAEYRYFGISALGHSPQNGSKIAKAGIRPYRVEDPILWLLSRLGSVPTNGTCQ